MSLDSAATWTDPTGTVWPLFDPDPELGSFTRPEVAGWGARPYEITTDPAPLDGETVRAIRGKGARITWPLHIWGDTRQQFLTRFWGLRRAFTMTAHRNTPGVLRVTHPDGSAREIQCYYEDGFTGNSGDGYLSANPVITLYAPGGYWQDATDTVIAKEYTPGGDFYAPFPNVSSGQVFGDEDVINPGDVPAWPTWVIIGPFSQFTATNQTTGRSFTLTAAVAAGQTVTITTTPTHQMVRGEADENLSSFLNWPAANLWPLVDGANAVRFVASGASVGSTINLRYRSRYEGV